MLLPCNGFLQFHRGCFNLNFCECFGVSQEHPSLVDTGELGMNGGFWARKTGADFSQWVPGSVQICSCLGLLIQVPVTDPWLQMPPYAVGVNPAGLAPEGQSI